MSPSRAVCVVGASRGLGVELAKQYAESGKVWGTTRSAPPSGLQDKNIEWVDGIDIAEESAGKRLAEKLSGVKLDLLIITAGYFSKESLDELNFDEQVKMYKICSIGPLFLVHHLYKAGRLQNGSKIILVSSEAGSIGLRHESEGGGMFGHHASKTALNMNGKLLSLDMKDKNIAVGMVHPGFMRTELTKSVGFDQFWDAGGAVTPDKAASSLKEFIEGFDISKTGTFWAPRGPGDIGTAEQTLGPKSELSTPLQLPW